MKGWRDLHQPVCIWICERCFWLMQDFCWTKLSCYQCSCLSKFNEWLVVFVFFQRRLQTGRESCSSIFKTMTCCPILRTVMTTGTGRLKRCLRRTVRVLTQTPLWSETYAKCNNTFQYLHNISGPFENCQEWEKYNWASSTKSNSIYYFHDQK